MKKNDIITSCAVNLAHPGIRIKQEIIPTGMSVTEAAKLIGVSRPALSNLLNGNAMLSPEMAARLAKAFNVPQDALMDFQTQYDLHLARQIQAPTTAIPYVPPFLSIKANVIEEWASHNIIARSRLAVFIRTLVHSTSSKLTKANFPGNDDAERPGWDGYIEAQTATPWVPEGISGWEFGTNVDIKTKATSDFNKSVKAISEELQKQTTFIFVTPRRWAGKERWKDEQFKRNIWKDVRAYDASDLEQWLEQSIPAQAWLANEIGQAAHQVRSLDQCWKDWADVCAPPLPRELFSHSVSEARKAALDYLDKPPHNPFYIGADSPEEALGFLAEIFNLKEDNKGTNYRSRIVIFDDPHTLRKLAKCACPFIPVVFTREAESELAQHASQMHSIIIYPRNTPRVSFNAVVDLISTASFANSLNLIGKSDHEISLLADKSGRSLTTLRRQLANVAAIQRPLWAADKAYRARLIPFMFAGTWDSKNKADKAALELLANDISYDTLERNCIEFSQMSDAPLWSIGPSRGVVSKLDLLHTIAGSITENDLHRFFEIAELVLGEENPALELPEDRRWLASIYGKKREFSSLFRNGVAETLTMLGVYGRKLFKQHAHLDINVTINNLIRKLLETPLTTKNLENHDSDLPIYAEAAPETFLSILEDDLRADSPALYGLLLPTSNGLWSSPKRTGILWALEGLAWNPSTFSRSVLILTQLAQTEINDNWVNKPINSLLDIFRSWMPQTTATNNERITLLKILMRNNPEVAWRICIEQFSLGSQIGNYTHRYRWRDEGMGFIEPNNKDVQQFLVEVASMITSWEQYTVTMLCELVERLPNFPLQSCKKIWKIISSWAITSATDEEKALLREKIRTNMLSRRAVKRMKKNTAAKGKSFLDADTYALLEPTDIINKHKWLFTQIWVDESADELENAIDDDNFAKRDERVQHARIEALKEVYAQKGNCGLFDLVKHGECAELVGGLLAKNTLSPKEITLLSSLTLKAIIEDQENILPQKRLLSGILHALDKNQLHKLVQQLSESCEIKSIAPLLLLSPFCKATWDIVKSYANDINEEYWSKVYPSLAVDFTAETHQAVTCLLQAKRPRAAFSYIHCVVGKIDHRLLYHILDAIAKSNDERTSEYLLREYDVEKAFGILNNSGIISHDEMATLEFAYVQLLNKIPQLELYIENHPEFFAQLVSWVYKPDDRQQNSVIEELTNEQIERMAERAHRTLDLYKKIPGCNTSGDASADKLNKWIHSVRTLCKEQGRSSVGDLCLGKLLAHSSAGKDGAWPCEEIRDIMEKLHSKEIINGMFNGAYNSRGVTWRSPRDGGLQELTLAEKYRGWEKQLQITHPFVASQLLNALALTYEKQAEQEDIESATRHRLSRF
ncbi:HigA family addiction module antitoxin [Desulfovibrio cuneatus]|uniref:HigA family addiction module antitoxin n=1 Tax=Desulfovibrio cuneatus TaxID=159728 RepID=UPI00040A1244|nr:HigA family addiction module antitoxin [Desulfovibrio cuneatus]